MRVTSNFKKQEYEIIYKRIGTFLQGIWKMSSRIDEQAISARLIKRGKELFDAPRTKIRFTGISDVDSFLNNITDYPHAFVLGCIMDRQMKTEKAWLIPFHFSENLGNFALKTLAGLSESDLRRIMSTPQPLHRYVDKMSGYFFSAVTRIVHEYDGEAAKIWTGRPSSATVVYRFLQFDGIGPKIASMAVNILAREFKIRFSDYYSVDISADVHVKRVFERLGLTAPNATVEHLVFRARGLYPEFPGLMDFATWEIGRNWCRPNSRNCRNCPMDEVCISSVE